MVQIDACLCFFVVLLLCWYIYIYHMDCYSGSATWFNNDAYRTDEKIFIESFTVLSLMNRISK